MEDNKNNGSLLLKNDPESILHNMDLLNLIPCEIDLTPTPFVIQ